MITAVRALGRATVVAIVVALFGVWFVLPTKPATAATRSSAPRRSPSPLRIALTFDDLPSTAELPPGYSASRLIGELVAALQRHRVSSATGFVIGERALSDADARAALSLWTHAGFEVGNHTYSHLSLEHAEASDYVADLGRMEPLMRALEHETRQTTRWFRYPFLEEGMVDGDRRAVLAAVGGLGYLNARVSLDFADWAFADAYARCLQNPEHLRTLERSYLQFAHETLLWSERLAHGLVGRPLAHVLLLHANVATARLLDQLLTQYEAEGASFVSLTEALADPLYQAPNESGLGNALTAAGAAVGVRAPASLEPPLELLDLACR